MTCTRFAQARILEAYDEPSGESHVASCDRCRTEIDAILEIRRLYIEVRPGRLHARVKQGIASRLRRERNRGRLQSALTSLAGVAAAVLLLAGLGTSPTLVAAAEPAPAGSMIDLGLSEVRTRIVELEAECPNYLDTTLEDLKARVGALTWDAENM